MARRWLRRLGIGFAVLVALALGGALAGWLWWRAQFLDSGGPLRPRQAAYDVRRYELEVAIRPESRTIAGHHRVILETTAALDAVELDLDDRLAVASVSLDGQPAAFRHAEDRLTVTPPAPFAAGERHTVAVAYGGRPKVAARPPWLDGLVWAETPGGEPWLGVTVQTDGADDWWPCKDHPADEPDEGMAIALTVPAGLVGLANGRKLGETANGDGTTTTRWEVSSPINNYLVTFNVGPYVPVEQIYRGVDGTLEVPILFWAIPEHVEPAHRLWQQAPRMLAVLGRRFGEYPFLADKYWVAETPYAGMEHQTLVAYGGDFEDNRYGFDDLLLHETAHEWWGNRVTARDWADFWIHEGFATYAEALFVLDTQGEEKYLEYMRRLARYTRNRRPLQSAPDAIAHRAYHGDLYNKGACVLHTLKWLVGDETFFAALARFAADADGFVATADFERLTAELAGRELPWFWQRYLRRAELPRWQLTRAPAGAGTETVELAWDDPAFELPLPVTVGGEARRVEMAGGRARLPVPAGAEVKVDPRGLVLARAADPR